ncbi:flavin reductase family protein [Erythrobacter rubeus]|uniref:Flavin reductase family protein n=1 Tax=Erythrobacter rubeus TaxID=2760803 RepID=A0ABR8KWS4_9SPHN|nr:flavin reductase family protein [Erythrobacter rubeus]MBD2842884.1 flavin reductase family protein [Erythrobacter rubeus]
MSDILPADPVDETEFRKLMGLFATGVCVVSFGENDGSEHPPISGMTINSLVSVSLEPMLVSWSLQNSSSQFADYAGAEKFAFSILADSQQAIARRYAARGDSALNHGDFIWTDRGIPVLRGAMATIECRRWENYPAGDHTIVLGEVLAMDAQTDYAHARALGFFNGRFCSVGN